MARFGWKDRHPAAVLRALFTERTLVRAVRGPDSRCACPGEPRFRETGSWFPRQHRKRRLPKGVLRSCAAFRASSKLQRVEHPLRQAVVSGMEPEVDGVPGKRAGLCPWCWSGRGPGREDGCSLGPSWEER